MDRDGDDADEVDNEDEMVLSEFCEGLAALSCYREPDPYELRYVTFDHFMDYLHVKHAELSIKAKEKARKEGKGTGRECSNSKRGGLGETHLDKAQTSIRSHRKT